MSIYTQFVKLINIIKLLLHLEIWKKKSATFTKITQF